MVQCGQIGIGTSGAGSHWFELKTPVGFRHPTMKSGNRMGHYSFFTPDDTSLAAFCIHDHIAPFVYFDNKRSATTVVLKNNADKTAQY